MSRRGLLLRPRAQGWRGLRKLQQLLQRKALTFMLQIGLSWTRRGGRASCPDTGVDRALPAKGEGGPHAIRRVIGGARTSTRSATPTSLDRCGSLPGATFAVGIWRRRGPLRGPRRQFRHGRRYRRTKAFWGQRRPPWAIAVWFSPPRSIHGAVSGGIGRRCGRHIRTVTRGRVAAHGVAPDPGAGSGLDGVIVPKPRSTRRRWLTPSPARDRGVRAGRRVIRRPCPTRPGARARGRAARRGPGRWRE